MSNIFENYSFLDQIQDTKIDLTQYLINFSDSNYTLEFNNNQPAITTVANLFEKYTVVEDFKQKNTSFKIHNITEGQMIEDVALDVYGSEDFWWVVSLFNDIKNVLTDWPMSEEQIQYIIDILVEKENKYTRDGYYRLIFNWNESRRRIEVLTVNQLPDFILQFQQEVINQPTDERFTLLI